MLISGAMLLGPPTGLHAVCTRVLACVPCVLAREDVWWSGSRLECQAHLSEGDGCRAGPRHTALVREPQWLVGPVVAPAADARALCADGAVWLWPVFWRSV